MSDAGKFRDLLARRGRPHILVYSGDATRLREHLDGLPRDVFNVWKIDGTRLTTQEAVFHEFTLKMRFPDYFGNNWDALDDLLSDLDWGVLDAVNQIVIIDKADMMLELGGQHGPFLLYLLDKDPEEYERWETDWAYKVILQAEKPGADALLAAFKAKGLEYAELALNA